MASTTEGGGVDDVTSMNGQKQVNDVMKKVIFDEIDRDGSYFSYLFMEKIFGENRTCQYCGAYGSGCVPSGNHSPEIYVIEEGIVGKQIVECVRCRKQETVLSHEDIEIPSDQRLRIRGLEVRYYCKKITHFEVLHDLLELLHVAAIEDAKRKKDRHADVASFMMQKAKRVCEEWCKTEYTELRYKKYLRLRHETLIEKDTKSSYPPEASDEYKEMYEMMANSFRSNRDKVIRLLELMKESLFDNPTRPSFMMWVSIAMMHSEQYQDFKMQYDPHSFKSSESSTYMSLKERFLSLSIPVGIKKIPVVFVLFELPRFYHYVDFLTRRMGKRKPLNFLTDSDKEELRKIDSETGRGTFSLSTETSHRGGIEEMTHHDCLVRVKPDDVPVMPRMVTSEQFRGHLLENLTHKKYAGRDGMFSFPVAYSPNWERKIKVIVKIETDESEDSELTPFQLKEALKRLAGMPSQSTESVRLTVTPPNKGGASAHLVMDNDSSTQASLSIGQRQSFSNAPISIPIPPTYSEPGAPVYASVETIENVPTEKLLAATTTHGFDLEALKKEMRLPNTKIVQNVEEEELKKSPSKVLLRIIKSCSDDITFAIPCDEPGKVTNKNPLYLKKCRVSPRPGNIGDHRLPYGMDRSLFEDHREVYTELPLNGPDGDFCLYPMMLSTDKHNLHVPVYPFMIRPAKKKTIKKCLENVGRLFGLEVGEPINEMFKEVFERYLKIGLVVARRPDLFEEVEYYGAIKRAMHKGFCILIHVSLPEIMKEAEGEMSELRIISRIKSLKEQNIESGVIGQLNLLEAIKEAKRITPGAAPGDSYLLVFPGAVISQEDAVGKKKKKKKRKGKKKQDEDDEEEKDGLSEEEKILEVKYRFRKQLESMVDKEPVIATVKETNKVNTNPPTEQQGKSVNNVKEGNREGQKADEVKMEVKEEVKEKEEKGINTVHVDRKEENEDEVKKEEVKEKEVKEKEMKEQEVKEQEVKKEKEMKEQEVKEKEVKEKEVMEQEEVKREVKEEEVEKEKVKEKEEVKEKEKEVKEKEVTEKDVAKREERKEEKDKLIEDVIKNGDKENDELKGHTNGDDKKEEEEVMEEGGDRNSVANDKSRKTVRDKFRECHNCHNAIDGKIRLCSGCKKVCYCNRDCQRLHWKEHKKTCSYILRKELTG